MPHPKTSTKRMCSTLQITCVHAQLSHDLAMLNRPKTLGIAKRMIERTQQNYQIIFVLERI